MGFNSNKTENAIVTKAKELGASLAGIAKIEDLRASKSYEIYANSPFYETYEPKSPNYSKFRGFKWRKEHKSVLVWALERRVPPEAFSVSGLGRISSARR